MVVVVVVGGCEGRREKPDVAHHREHPGLIASREGGSGGGGKGGTLKVS